MRQRSRVGLSVAFGLVASAGAFVLSSSQALALSAAIGYAGGVYLLTDALGTAPLGLDEAPFLTSRKFLAITVLVSLLLLSTVDGIASSQPTTDRVALYTVLVGCWLFFAGYGAVFRAESRPDSHSQRRGKQAFDRGSDD
jgi:hypothetical protein